MEDEWEQRIHRLNILNEIYKNENEQMKLEYVLLSYEHQKLQTEYQILLNEHQRLVNKLDKNIVVKIYRIVKRILKKILRR